MSGATPLLIGALLAFATGVLGRIAGLDRDRAFYPTVLIVVASYFSLFAVMGASTTAIVLETLVGGAFVAVAILGFRSSLWLVVIGLAVHGLSDLPHGKVISNPGVPDWWPAFCMAFDVIAAGFLAWLITRGSVRPGA